MNASGFSSWPTATAMDAERRNYLPSHHQGLPLTEAVILWTTPQAHDVTARGSGQKPSSKAGNACLATDAAQWPTPAAQNWKGSSPDSVTRADGKSRMDILHYRAEQGFTPPALPTLPHGAKPSSRKGGSTSYRLLRLMMRSYGPTITRRLWASRDKRRLNPLFVEWLMGWPTGHALCGCSATEFSRWSQDMRGSLSRLPMASGPWILIEVAPKPQPVQRSLFE